MSIPGPAVSALVSGASLPRGLTVRSTWVSPACGSLLRQNYPGRRAWSATRAAWTCPSADRCPRTTDRCPCCHSCTQSLPCRSWSCRMRTCCFRVSPLPSSPSFCHHVTPTKHENPPRMLCHYDTQTWWTAHSWPRLQSVWPAARCWRLRSARLCCSSLDHRTREFWDRHASWTRRHDWWRSPPPLPCQSCRSKP